MSEIGNSAPQENGGTDGGRAGNGAARGGGRAAGLIDEKFEQLASTLDKLRLDLIAGEGENKPAPLIGGFANRLGAASDGLRNAKGEEVVAYAKKQAVRHPLAITVGAAAVGAALAQLAVAAARREDRPARRSKTQQAAS